jgi:hypothetical protein
MEQVAAASLAQVKGALTGTFQDRFCSRHRIPRDQFNDLLFRKGLFLHARLLAPIATRLWPNFFAEDLQFIQEIANVTCPDIVHFEINRFHGRNVREKRWMRRVARIRMSGRKLQKINRQLFKA